MAWYISKDKIDNGDAVGEWNGLFKDQSYYTEEGKGLAKCKEICKKKFRVLDDDGEIYYYGYSNDSDSEKAFLHLMILVCQDAGCTEIQYYDEEKKEWETL